MDMIRTMHEADWDRVREIYNQGIEGGTSTFNRVCPDYAQWDELHHADCRFVYEQDGEVVGWIALSPTSRMPAYRGVAEVSVYIHNDYHGRGIGTALMRHMCTESEKAGYWCLYSAICSINAASLALHKKCGFRVVGTRTQIAVDRFGQWQDTTIMERRNAIRETAETLHPALSQK